VHPLHRGSRKGTDRRDSRATGSHVTDSAVAISAAEEPLGELRVRARAAQAEHLLVAYHLLTQAGMAWAPWPITTLVSCLPVLVLAMGTALAHMLRADGHTATDGPDHAGTVLHRRPAGRPG
jgi:hypothetical protein